MPKEHQAHAEPPPHSTSHLAARAARHLAASGELRAPGGREQPTTLVLGGGIAGIAAAVGLAERGVRVTLVEQHPTVLLPALLWCMAMHAHSAAPDITADREAGVATVATLFGRQRTLVLCGLAYGLAPLWSTRPSGPSRWSRGAYLAMIALSLRSRGPEQLFAVYRLFPVVNTVVGGAMFCVVGIQQGTWPFN